MSSGPTLTGKDVPVSATYYNLKISKKDWCMYFKECPMEYNVPGSYCWACKFRRAVDIPNLLAERGRGNRENHIRTSISNTQ